MPAITVTSDSGGTLTDNLYISGPVQVTIQTAMPDAKIYYTLDGHTPTLPPPLIKDRFESTVRWSSAPSPSRRAA
jgi:hypothetical protein